MSVKQVLFEYLDTLAAGSISGWRLFEDIAKRTGRKTYPQTLLDYAREYTELAGAEFNCIDNQKSVYFYKPGAKIASAIFD
ncbi:MAG: hypothetical protein KKB59_14240 [Spirochaetes bacterium]|nr:hypothetical protein [Spirochaetota bacterium]